MIIIHTAEIRLGPFERIIEASLVKGDIDRAVKIWRREYPGRQVRYRTILGEE